MKLNKVLFAVVLLPAGLGVLAEEAPPAEPPVDEGDVDPIGWKKTLGEARQAASAKNGYALILVTAATPASERTEISVLSRPEISDRLKQDYGCLKGTLEDLAKDDQAKKKVADAGVTEAPAVILVEPDDGAIVDVTKGEITPKQFQRLLEDIDRQESQKKLEERAAKEGGDAVFRLKVGRARMRKADYEGARRDFEAAAKGEDKKIQAQGMIGQASVLVATKDFKGADKLLGEAMAMFVEEEEIKDFESPMAEGLYLQVWSAWGQDLREDATKYARKLMETWPMSSWMQLLYGRGLDMGWNWYEGKEIPK
ncbi:MAG: hypothetical protein HYY18_14815 [Planctomycetes bacterium]|nr:hypothetical protein [Planctomycetota bacterium]